MRLRQRLRSEYFKFQPDFLTLLKRLFMGRPKEPYDKEFRGTIDGIVVRQNKVLGTIWSASPDMSNVIPSANQLKQREKFAKAQRYAKEFLSVPANKAFYKELCKPGQRPHNVLISELLKGVTLFPAK